MFVLTRSLRTWLGHRATCTVGKSPRAPSCHFLSLLVTGTIEEVFVDGLVVHHGGSVHEQVPDGVSEGNPAVHLEEEDSHDVEATAKVDLFESRGGSLRLKNMALLCTPYTRVPSPRLTTVKKKGN